MSLSQTDIDLTNLPRHVAIIMDGNGRWAKKRGLPRVMGHKRGVEVARRIIIKARELGIPYLSLFAFSKENWQRPRLEVETLLKLLGEYLENELPLLMEKSIRFKALGDVEDFPEDLRDKIREVERATAAFREMTLVLALSYSGRAEILRAIRFLTKDFKDGGLKEIDLNDETFRQYLYFPELPDPDLLIRTSGEIRISNFFLYQIAYTELYFSDLLWPDFSEEEFVKALGEYQRRERRFGRVYEF
ncbi:MAG: isoprenyl transferase [Caldimicrobium sp.]|nr:isoprenyl transferase [Caldimicrobium sp.]MCX7614083.1 isoprenyl transferase [Caldimicrobium sp.]MDW8182838.1 isoprenyl transferase [Caldimicrobium sp.]